MTSRVVSNDWRREGCRPARPWACGHDIRFSTSLRDAVEGRHRDAVEGRRRDVVEDRRTETPSSTSLDGCSAGADKRVELTDFKGLVVEPGGVVKKLELDSSASEPFIERRLLTMFEGASGG